jgi:hypothetical protein
MCAPLGYKSRIAGTPFLPSHLSFLALAAGIGGKSAFAASSRLPQASFQGPTRDLHWGSARVVVALVREKTTGDHGISLLPPEDIKHGRCSGCRCGGILIVVVVRAFDGVVGLP